MKSRFFALCLLLSACGVDLEPTSEPEEQGVQQAALCKIFLYDQPGYVGPLQPSPVISASGACVNLPITSTSNRTSSFRLAGCKVTFFDGANCLGANYSASSSGNMPPAFDNVASSLIQW